MASSRWRPLPGVTAPAALDAAAASRPAPLPPRAARGAVGRASRPPRPAARAEAPSASTAAEAFGIGEPAPPLVLPLVGGDTIDLADYRGKPVWVNFMATWCPPCRDELPLMAGFAARYEDTGLVILAVDVKEDEAAVQTFFQDLNLFFPVASTRRQAPADWGASRCPSTSGSTRTGSCATGRWAGSGRT